MADYPFEMLLPSDPLPNRAIIIQSYLQDAISSHNETRAPVSLFNPPDCNIAPKQRTPRCPILKGDSENKIFLYPGSFNPPHQGHLATIHHFFERRKELEIVAFFIFADPDDIIATKEKKWGKIILPQELRNRMFAQVPELAHMMKSGWLHLLVGDMEGHIQVLRKATYLISAAGFDVKLVGFLGGDKLSIDSPPHLPPGDLPVWGPVDEFFIMNARRPVDFYNPEQGAPQNLPGCSVWARVVPYNDLEMEQERSVGMLWVCQALTVSNQPVIQFRASVSSASNGISSTRIRKIMSEASEEDIYQLLKDQVLSVEILVEWLAEYRRSQTKGVEAR